VPIIYGEAAEAIPEGRKWLINPVIVTTATIIPITIRKTPNSIPKKLLPLFNSMRAL
jgi:hypothetical protein